MVMSPWWKPTIPKYGKNFPLGFDKSLFIQKPWNWGLGLRSTMAKELDGDPPKKKLQLVMTFKKLPKKSPLKMCFMVTIINLKYDLAT
jgi:hypothetical protein